MGQLELVTFGEYAVFVLMGIASVIAVAVGLERAVVFNKSSAKSAGIIKSIVERLRKKEYGALAEVETSSPKNVYARFASFGSEHKDSGAESLSELLAAKAIEERIYLERRL
nr:MotA/TolQ/ExbB proton channel family protein [Leptospiraceae bacterium]